LNSCCLRLVRSHRIDWLFACLQFTRPHVAASTLARLVLEHAEAAGSGSGGGGAGSDLAGPQPLFLDRDAGACCLFVVAVALQC
jgi:hypothetical protein